LTDRLYRNVGKQVCINAAHKSRGEKSSAVIQEGYLTPERIGTIGCTETSVNKYVPTLRINRREKTLAVVQEGCLTPEKNGTISCTETSVNKY